MPKEVRKDLSYFTLDCNIFSKTAELRPLLRKFKADGLAVYIHILCDVYGTAGYYFKPEDYEGYLLDIAEDCGITVGRVQLIIAFMADRTLLDAFSLNKNTVFTSHGIQKRYAQAMKGRKRSVAEIKGDYWILTDEEEEKIDTFYKSHTSADKSEKMSDKSEKMSDKSEIYKTTEHNRNKQNETELILEERKKEIYKNLSSNEYGRETYDELMDRWEIGRNTPLRAAFEQFIRHCSANGQVLTNDRLEDIICRLYDYYGAGDKDSMCDSLKRAISGGYYDIKEGKR